MKFTDIYENVIPFWGLEIDISDGETDEPGTEESEDYFFSDRFARKWKEVERKVGYENSYAELMVWTMYQVFHRYAKARFDAGYTSIFPQEIDKWEIEEQYFLNLKDRIWKEELAAYERE